MSDRTGTVWLRLQPDRLPELQVLSYSMQRPLLAAFVAFTFEKSQSDQRPGRLKFSGEGRVRIPLKDAYEFKSSSEYDPSDESLIAFHEASESEKQTRTQSRWSISLNQLLLFETGDREPVKTLDVPEDCPGQVLSAVQLIPAFQSVYTPQAKFYAGQFVSGHRVTALQIVEMARTESQHRFEVSTASSDQLFGLSDWDSITWMRKNRLEFSWCSRENTLLSLKIKVPILGELELRRNS